MLKWSSTPTLKPMRCHSLFCEVVQAADPSTEPAPATKRRRCPHLRSLYGAAPSENTVRPVQCRRQNFKVTQMAKVAFLGLGVMGFPMAGHLVKKGGHEVTVYNRTGAKAKEWADKFGGRAAPTP